MAKSGDGDDGRSQGTTDRARKAPQPLPRVDFSTLVLSIGTTALYQMGVVPDPETGAPGTPDALTARQTIDTLEMLRDKTRGNLDDEERKLIDSLLYELQMRFLEIGR